MAKVTGIGGVFFKSKGDSAALAAWYRQHLGMTLEDFGGAGASAAHSPRELPMPSDANAPSRWVRTWEHFRANHIVASNRLPFIGHEIRPIDDVSLADSSSVRTMRARSILDAARAALLVALLAALLVALIATTAGAQPVRRGLNSVQLYEDGEGWHIASVLWDVERAGTHWPPELAPRPSHP